MRKCVLTIPRPLLFLLMSVACSMIQPHQEETQPGGSTSPAAAAQDVGAPEGESNPTPAEAMPATDPVSSDATPAGESTLYRLNVGDLIEIKSAEDPSLIEQARIGPDGMISYGLVGYVHAEGKTLPELDEMLTSELRKVIRQPKITIFIREYLSQIVYVGGEVKQPKEVRISGGLTALSAVFAAGGFTDGANRNVVTLIRKGSGGKAERFALDLDKDQDRNLELRGLDVLIIPPTVIAQADLYVEQYINKIIPNAVNVGFTYIIGNTALR